MKNRKFLWLIVSLLLLAVPAVQTSAFDDEVEIELFEVVNASFLPGDNPLDDPSGEGLEPPQPTSFHATITGQTLAVTSGIYSARLIVRNSAGAQVLDRQFAGGTVEQLSTGSYSLEIQSGSLTLVGQFSAH